MSVRFKKSELLQQMVSWGRLFLLTRKVLVLFKPSVIFPPMFHSKDHRKKHLAWMSVSGCPHGFKAKQLWLKACLSALHYFMDFFLMYQCPGHSFPLCFFPLKHALEHSHWEGKVQGRDMRIGPVSCNIMLFPVLLFISPPQSAASQLMSQLWWVTWMLKSPAASKILLSIA